MIAKQKGFKIVGRTVGSATKQILAFVLDEHIAKDTFLTLQAEPIYRNVEMVEVQ